LNIVSSIEISKNSAQLTQTMFDRTTAANVVEKAKQSQESSLSFNKDLLTKQFHIEYSDKAGLSQSQAKSETGELRKKMQDNKLYFNTLMNEQSFCNMLSIFQRTTIPNELFFGFFYGTVSAEECLGNDFATINLLKVLCSEYLHSNGSPFSEPASHYLLEEIATRLAGPLKNAIYEARFDSSRNVLMMALTNASGSTFLLDHLLFNFSLSKADLRGKDLRGADLHGVNLTMADLTGADLTGTDLSAAILCKANLTDADLRKANLTDANLRPT